MPTRASRGSTELFYHQLANYLRLASIRFEEIPQERKVELAHVAEYVRERLEEGLPARLTFICTHNSRRSHLAQIWAQLAAHWFGLSSVETFSGGTEATAFNPRAVAALIRCGLKIESDSAAAANPNYLVFWSDSAKPIVCFSKVYDSPPNPTKDYCAVMTCSQADEGCPLVMGCDLRVPIRYEDPKSADDTPLESIRYDERSAQICSEMLYLMSLV